MSISSRITQMEQHIGNAYDKIEDLGIDLTDVDKNIDNISSMLEEVWNEYPKVSVTDVEEASLDGTKKGRMEIDLKGNTEQEQLEGKNLFNPLLLSQQENYNTYNSSTGLWTTSSREAWYLSILYYISGNTTRDINKLIYLPQGKYTIRIYDFVNNTGHSSPINYRLFNNLGEEISSSISGSTTYVLNIEQDCYLDICRTNSTGTLSFSKIMIVSGEYTEQTMPSFEPYCGGIPSPNPNYPQTIHNVIGSNEFKIQNKNLLNSLTKTQGYPSNTAQAPSTTRLFTENTYVLGIATNNYYAPSTVSIEKCNEDEWEFKTIYSGYGISFPINFALNGSYRLSYEKKGNVNSALLKYDKTGNFIESVFNNVFEIDKNFNYLMLFYTFTTNETVGFSKAQIEQGTTATDFVEHKEQNLPLSLRSKNLANINAISNTSIITISNDTIILSNNDNIVGYTDTGKKLSEICPNLQVGDTVILNFNTTSNSSSKGIIYIGESWIRNKSKIITQSMLDSNVVIYGGHNETAIISEFQIEISTTATATDYEPYYNYELSKIGDAEDYFYKENEKWYLHKEIEKVVLNGSENISLYQTSSTRTIFRYNIGDNFRENYEYLLCNYFIAVSQASTWKFGDISVRASTKAIYFTVEGNTTLEDFKTWLSTHNTEVYYLLATPTNTEITETTLINQLEAIRKAQSYDDQTNISQTNEDLPFILNIEALKK